jgi:hypothetical protein
MKIVGSSAIVLAVLLLGMSSVYYRNDPLHLPKSIKRAYNRHIHRSSVNLDRLLVRNEELAIEYDRFYNRPNDGSKLERAKIILKIDLSSVSHDEDKERMDTVQGKLECAKYSFAATLAAAGTCLLLMGAVILALPHLSPARAKEQQFGSTL